MPIFICPNCGDRSTASERTAGFQNRAQQCGKCGFGFLFELLDDYYPAPNAGFVVCDSERRILAIGRGVFELSGMREQDLLGRDLVESFALSGFDDGRNPAELALEWGVRRMGENLELRTRSGQVKKVTVDFFPAYDSDGGLLVALAPR